eukprot:SAG11_NODE_71_length_18338_cov_14.752974_2_plen_87_part_00
MLDIALIAIARECQIVANTCRDMIFSILNLESLCSPAGRCLAEDLDLRGRGRTVRRASTSRHRVSTTIDSHRVRPGSSCSLEPRRD